ncbi:MAG: hypothetical protein ACREQL_10860 [Candidatus Binatia bacterium]
MRSVLPLVMLMLVVGPMRADAGGSSPLLTITTADTFANPAGVTSVDVRGSFNFEDVVEGVFPAGLVVYQGTHFARFDQAGAVVDGTAALLSDGLDTTEVPALVGLGVPAPSPAVLARLRADRVSVVLPSGFAPGPASVVLYAVYEGLGYGSNTVTVTLP